MTKSNKKMMIVGLGGLGNVAGIVIAVKRKSGFWGGVGWFLVAGMAGSMVGYVATSIIPDSPETVDINVNVQPTLASQVEEMIARNNY